MGESGLLELVGETELEFADIKEPLELVEAEEDIEWLPDVGSIETPLELLEEEETGDAIEEVGEDAAE